MKRQYVHLSTTLEKAFEVGQRKGDDTVILVIRTEALVKQGIHFYKGNDLVWLADAIPVEGIEVPEPD